MPNANDIRQQFIDFFHDKAGHTIVPSSPVVPHDDPTLLFANAGMNQFKPYFLGTEQPPYPRAVDTQKCIRAGGKHNDLEDVGKDSYHHTFFEMLGNWSFGDYFKQEAIDWAWELLVNVWGIDPKRLHATYFEGDAAEGLEPDLEARDLWLKHLPADHVHPGNKKDNFWEMGDTGPCGPCSEIHYDRTPDLSGAKLVNADAQDDVIEIWNLVFIQFNRGTDGKLSPLPAKHVDTGMGFERIVRVLQNKTSNYDTDVFTPLFAAIQEVTGAKPYSASMEDHTDIAYRVLADHIRCLTFALTDGAVPSNEKRGYVLRSILRRAMFYGRYQLGVDLPDSFLYKLVDAVVALMGDAFPELKKDPTHVKQLIREEEESFGRTIDRGIKRFNSEIFNEIGRKIRERNKTAAPSDQFRVMLVNTYATVSMKQHEEEEREFQEHGSLPLRGNENVQITNESNNKVDLRYPLHNVTMRDLSPWIKKPIQLGAQVSFQLHDTYGFPIGLTNLIAEERGMTVDVAGFEKLMDEARERSRAGGGGGDARQSLVELVQKGELPATEFVGYEHTQLLDEEMNVWLFMQNGTVYERVPHMNPGDEGYLVTERTPFYAESGGQVGDTGIIRFAGGGKLTVEDTIKIGDVHFHRIRCDDGPMQPTTGKRKLSLLVREDRRSSIMNNHTTTHVMNRALRDHVNSETMQKGSLVDGQRLRFDFSHKAALTEQELAAVEQQVNEDIAKDLVVYTDYVEQDRALKIHSLRAVFGEKYPPVVRVVSIGVPVGELLEQPDNADWVNYSIEFCGGTHLPKTGDAEGFCIVSQEAVSKGVRRVTALTGAEAHKASAEADRLLNRAQSLLTAEPDTLIEQIDALTKESDAATLPVVGRAKLRELMTELSGKVKQIQKQQGNQAEQAVVESAQAIADGASGPVIVAQVPGADGKTLRNAMDVVRKKHAGAAIFLAADAGGKVALMATVTKEQIGKGLKAGDWIKHVAPIVGGGGGGRPDSAQAGGKDPAKLPEALDAAKTFANDVLG